MMANDRLFGVFAVFVANLIHVSQAEVSLGEVADKVGSLFSAVEDCTYSCSNGGNPVDRPGFRPTSNGCGSFGVTFDLKSMPGMTECCNTHDFCYGRCNSDKAACDRELRSCFNNICLKKEVEEDDEEEIKECQEITLGSFDLVRSFLGCRAFEDAQDETCMCKDNRRRKRSIYLEDVLDEMETLRRK